MSSRLHPRHLSLSGFLEYLDSGVPTRIPFEGSPSVALIVDPGQRRLSLRASIPPDDPTTASPNDRENVTIRQVRENGQSWLDVTLTDPALFATAYPVLCAIADRIQLEGNHPVAAIEETLRHLGRLLARSGRLSTDQEIGLVGELTLLAHLAREIGPEAAVRAWRVCPPEEHDFSFPACDAEVKTTTDERRQHWIGSPAQLQPSPGRSLWLVSVQVTGAGEHPGGTLGELVTRVRRLTEGTVVRDTFERQLTSAGWRDEDENLYPRRWRLRSTPAVFHVDADFPSVTWAGLHHACSEAHRIVDWRYRIDLTGLPTPSAAPVDLGDLSEMRMPT